VSSGVLIFPPLKKLEELLGPPLLKETHEGTADCLHLVTRDLRDLAVTVDKAASDLLELKVPGDIGMDEDLGELSRRDDELGDQVNSIVTIPSKLLWDGLIRPKLAVELV
jgi:hypothetical protein